MKTATEAFYRQIKMTMDGFGEPKYPAASRFDIFYHILCWFGPLALILYPAIMDEFGSNLVQLRWPNAIF